MPRPTTFLRESGPFLRSAALSVDRSLVARRDACTQAVAVSHHLSSAILFSTINPVGIDPSEPTPLYQQIAAEIRRAIADGEAKPGERMPLAKDFATVLGVNTNTVLRALRELREEGLLEFRRGHGITVAGTPERGAVLAKARELVVFARRHGYRPDELVAIIKAIS